MYKHYVPYNLRLSTPGTNYSCTLGQLCHIFADHNLNDSLEVKTEDLFEDLFVKLEDLESAERWLGWVRPTHSHWIG